MTGISIARASTVSSGRQAPASIWQRLLAAPLLTKLIGANALIVVVAAVALWSRPEVERYELMVLGSALLISVIANVALTRLALRPFDALDVVATSVWRGNLDERVGHLPLADARMRRLSVTLNRLLDGLAADRERMRQLASQVIAAQDAERARIARELHDSAAQSIAALSFLLSAAARDGGDGPLVEKIREAQLLASSVLDEVRGIAHGMHPRVLEDLGLVSALEGLARATREHSGVEVTVEGKGIVDVEVPRAVSGTLYRVAQEALANATRHAGASRITITVAAERARARLEVRDDGRGFDPGTLDANRTGLGLFSIRERAALVHGDVTIDSAPGQGTRVVATVPLTEDNDNDW